jgi:DNA polymerase III epsilon subunit-like protein
MHIIFFDTETTGNEARDRLCQLAAKERGVAGSIVNALYKPPMAIPFESMAIHHITEKMVAGKPAFVDAPEYSSLKKLFENDDTLAVAHNAAFDVGVLAHEKIFPKKVICTLKVANTLDPDDAIPSYKLQYLRYLLGIEIDAVAHDAFGDVLVLEAVFERLLQKMIELKGSEEAALAEMIAISNSPMLFTTIHFGKHNGKKLKDIAREDPSYLRWLLDQKKQNPDGEADWIYTLEHFLGRSA